MKASERQQKLKNDYNETCSLLQVATVTIYILKISHSVYFSSLLVKLTCYQCVIIPAKKRGKCAAASITAR